MAGLQFLPLCDEVAVPWSRLAVDPKDAHLISPNGVWMAQAALTPDARTFCVADTVPVGLVSLIDPRVADEDNDHFTLNCLYVWRLMVDGTHRRKGYGAQIIDFVKTYAQLVGLSGVTLTTMDTEPRSAVSFYEKLGFTQTGRRLNGEAEFIWRP